MPLLQCYNKGCMQKFDPEENHKDACLYHPGPHYFHDAYKIWECCNRKSTDFNTWLSYKGCTKGSHNPEKPADILKVSAVKEIRPENPEDVIVWNGLNKPAERNGVEARKMIGLKMETTDAARKSIDAFKQTTSADPTDGVLVSGAKCKNSGCNDTYNGPESNSIPCMHHPGTAVFHEGMKYWSCCERKTSDFSNFLDQSGCTKGQHNWCKNERVDKIREDFFQDTRSGQIHVNIYCKGALPDQCKFESNGLYLQATVVHGFGNKETVLNYDLWGEIEADKSKVVIGERKVEMVLSKKEPIGWPRLTYNAEGDKKE
uniref:Cysteine and histidine-rich domain-containing protein n=1 Tax=Acrobeloides nanus TaxID=290746 RepID=A0A914ENT1_9BILA